MKLPGGLWNAQQKDLLGKIGRITWPAFIELVLTTLFGMVDMVMLGRYSSESVAAVGLTNQPFMLLMACFAAINVGATTLIAWNIGAGNPDGAKGVARQSMLINLILGVALSILGILAARPVVLFMGGNEDTLDIATGYFRIISAGLVFQQLNMAVTAALRGAGRTRAPMYYNLVSNLLNVLGNYLLIYGHWGFPRMGADGAAISTTVSRLIGCAMALYVVFNRRGDLPVALRLRDKWRFDFPVIRRMLAIGGPSSAEQFILQGGFTLFARTVAGLGTQTFAAHQIALNICGLTFSPSNAFGVAATTLVGQALGAGERKLALRIGTLTHHMALIVACAMGAAFMLLPQAFARLYTDDPQIVAMAAVCLRLMGAAQPGQSTQLSLAGALRGAGDTMFPLYASIAGVWIFRVGLAYLFVSVFGWGLVGAWVAVLVDQYTRASVVFARYHSRRWLRAYDRLQTADARRAP